MALNIPMAPYDATPGYTAMGKQNALTQGALENEIKKIEAKYAPLTAQANAISKIAYSNLMGPQFLAKLMGNEDILANMTPEQRTKALQMVYAAGSGQGSGNSLMNNSIMGNQSNQDQSSRLSDTINNIKNAFGFSGSSSASSQPNNALLQNESILSNDDKSAINKLQPGQSYVVQGNGANSGMSFDQNGNNVVATPDEINQVANRGNADTFAEKAGDYAGIKQERQESGKIRANDMKELADIVFTGQTKQATLDNIADIISSPEFEQIRRTPILGHNELSYYQRYGTPAQQNMVGQLMTLSGNIIKDSARDFAGQFRKGEQQLLENMKINPGDTIDAAKGKMEQLSYLNKLITERARLTNQYMSKGHLNKLQAEEYADKNISGSDIRSQIHNQLNPKPTDEDINFMAEKYKTTPDEIRKRLKQKGIF